MIRNTLAVISDIHGNRWALEEVLKDIDKRGLKRIVNLGDSFFGPLDPHGTAELLLPRDIPTICGNEDRMITEATDELSLSSTIQFVRSCLSNQHLNWLSDLKPSLTLEIDVLLVHGTPAKDTDYMLWEVCKDNCVRVRKQKIVKALIEGTQESLVLCGHSHVPCDMTCSDGTVVVDPGSVGLQAFIDDYPFEHKMENGDPKAKYALVSRNKRTWEINRVSLNYDWQRAANTALGNGRKDWANWLSSGIA